MQENQIKPDKITKPIQLLAAWLIGLIILTGSLLTAAATISTPSWLPAFFAISAVSIIPVFLILIFLLQTKYRPEMQEDTFYSKYLDRNTMTFEYIDKPTANNIELNNLRNEIISISEKTKNELNEVRQLIVTDGKKTKEEKAIETIIENSDHRLEELKKIAKITNIELHVNVNLPKYSEISDVIIRMGFLKYVEFGQGKTLPVPFLASFGREIPLDIIRDLVFKLIPFGLTYIKEIDSIGTSHRSNSIFLGSYANTGKSIKVTETLINKLKHITPELKFDDVFKN